MNSEATPNQVSIIRRLNGESATILCRSATITLLEDSAGINRHWFAQALLQSPPQNEGRVELNGKPLQYEQVKRVGFGEKLPESGSIHEFLSLNGCSDAEIASAIDELELQKQLYMGVAALPPPAARGLLLYLALRDPSPILFLNDPFQPLNGRWREYFAAELLRAASQTNRLVVVSNLSFIPQCWSTANCFQRIDVAGLFKPEVVQLKPTSREELAAQAAAMDSDRLERQAIATIKLPIPEGLVTAYKEVADHIFAPLARLSNTLRGYSGGLAMLAIALIIAVGATIMIPNLPQARALLVQLAETFGTAEPMAILPEQHRPHENSEVKPIENTENGSTSLNETRSADDQATESGTETGLVVSVEDQLALEDVEEGLSGVVSDSHDSVIIDQQINILSSSTSFGEVSFFSIQIPKNESVTESTPNDQVTPWPEDSSENSEWIEFLKILQNGDQESWSTAN